MPNAQRHVSHGLLCEEARRRMASAGGNFNWSDRGASATGHPVVRDEVLGGMLELDAGAAHALHDVRLVHDDAPQPRLQRAALAEAAPKAERPHEPVVNRLVGERLITQNRDSNTQKPAVTTVIDRLGVTTPMAFADPHHLPDPLHPLFPLATRRQNSRL